MSVPLAAVTLTGSLVRLETLTLDHAETLADAAAADRSTFGLTFVPDGLDATRNYIESLLAAWRAGGILPFAQVDVATGRAVGCTRYLDMRWWRGRDHPDEVEIGGSWLARTAQGTGLNTESKYLLLRQAFEVYGAWRVQIVTDARNAQSRGGIEAIGATFEGILRNHRVARDATTPAPRHTAVYSVIVEEWPDVATHLLRRLAARGVATPEPAE